MTANTKGDVELPFRQKVLFLTGLFPKEEEAEILSLCKTLPQMAANHWSWALVKGLEENACPVEIITSIFVGSFPRYYRQLFVESGQFSHASGREDHKVGFFNLFALKQLHKAVKLRRFFAKRARIQDFDILLLYSLNFPFLHAAKYLKKRNPSILTCMISLDLPEYMNFNGKTNPLVKLLQGLNRRYIYKAIQDMDAFVLLTEPMAQKMGIANKPYTVVEGIIDEQRYAGIQSTRKRTDGRFIITYAGGLFPEYGVNNALDAIMMIKDPMMEFHIFGTGQSEEYIRACERKDGRIKYGGILDGREVLERYTDSDLIMNPRQADYEFAKYSFPSKNLEAMMSGTPLVGFKLLGIPEEYYQHMFLFEEASPYKMSAVLERIMAMPRQELWDRGEGARLFVAKEKNAKTSTSKIIDLLNILKREEKDGF